MDRHVANAFSPIDSIPVGMVTSFKDIQPIHNPYGIFFIPEPISTDSREKQFSNILFSSVSTLSGILTDFKDKHP